MACGTVVVGYHGLGGREFFDPTHAVAVEAGDVVAFARDSVVAVFSRLAAFARQEGRIAT